MQLGKPRKLKGLWRIIFSRFFVIGLIILLQLAIIISLYIWLGELIPFLTVFEVIFSFIMVFFIFNG